MRWEDERYVRLYTRDTPEWCVLSWEARAFWALLLRAVDRAGVLPVGKAGLAGVAAMLRMPPDVVECAVAELVEDGCLVEAEGALVVRNYVEAQNARASDKARQQASRERARDDAASRPVTRRHTPSQPVTPNCAVPSPAQPSPEKHEAAAPPAGATAPPGSAGNNPGTTQEPPDGTERVYDRWRELWHPKAGPLDEKRRKLIRARLRERTVDQLLDSLAGWKHDPWPDRPRQAALKILLRDAEQVDRGLDLFARAGGPAPPPPEPEPCVACGKPAAVKPLTSEPSCVGCFAAWLPVARERGLPDRGPEFDAGFAEWAATRRGAA